MNWFSSDHHFNHFNIIEYCNRPFLRWQEMNEVLIERHNSRVSANDTVFILGDFKFGSNGPNTYDLRKRLNGNLVFIRGNHDKNNGLNVCMERAFVRSFGQDFLLIHRPDDVLKVQDHFDFALVGHVHEKWKFRENERGDKLINVGVDVWDFYPVHLKQILKAYKMKGREIPDPEYPDTLSR
jgi:calcineurin-like phosphoesterase family protein